MKESGLIIRQRRKELKFTQKQVAAYVGVDPVSVGHWERGTHRPKGENLMRLARKLDLKPEAIVGEKALKESEVERQAELIRQAYMSSSPDLRAAADRMFGTIQEIDSEEPEKEP